VCEEGGEEEKRWRKVAIEAQLVGPSTIDNNDDKWLDLFLWPARTGQYSSQTPAMMISGNDKHCWYLGGEDWPMAATTILTGWMATTRTRWSTEQGDEDKELVNSMLSTGGIFFRWRERFMLISTYCTSYFIDLCTTRL
jgi:hypothetical protein